MDKAYIVANKEQEIEFLKKFEEKGLVWRLGENATDFVPSENDFFDKFASFPYAIIEKEFIIWSPMEQLEDENIIYDGRKEEKMDKKYLVTQEFMNQLVEWRNNQNLDVRTGFINKFVDGKEIENIPDVICTWWIYPANPLENNNRLIAIIKWLNGEEVFEVEAPHKFIVRSERTKSDGDYSYVKVVNNISLPSYFNYATKFNTREEAQEWANSHQVVVEIDEEGNEVK